MFKRLFGKKDQPKAGKALVFICLADGGAVDWQRVRAALGVDGGEAPSPGEAAATFDYRGTHVIAMHMPVPIPGNEVAGQADLSRYWEPGLTTEHASHVVVTGISDNVLNGLESVSMVARAISSTHETVAWYCGNASQILKPDVASDLVVNGAYVAVWVNVLCTPNPRSGLDASTIGLEAMGHNEFEIVGTKRDVATVYELLMDLSVYVLENGPVLKHGQTFGRSATEKFGIEVGSSRLGKRGKVIRLGLP